MDLKLSLKPEPTADISVSALSDHIRQIEAQYGSFREITAETLKEEIQKGPTTEDEDVDMGGDKPEDEAKSEENRKLLETAIQLVHMAQTEIHTALDLVSLAISGSSVEVASQTLSSEIKNLLPMGSISMENISYERPAEEIEEDKLLAQGWKIEGLRSAANALRAASARLSQEEPKEKKYWDGVLKVHSDGWAISPASKERGGLTVRYGFIEAGDEFKNKGVGQLRRGEDGSIIVSEISSDAGKEKAIRVCIRHGDNIIASSVAPMKSASDSELTDTIEKSRNSLWAEELVFEIMKEARTLAGYGVTLQENSVTININGVSSAIIDIVPRETDEDADIQVSKDEQALATGIRHALNLLLSQAHAAHLRSRSRPPKPLGNADQGQGKAQPQNVGNTQTKLTSLPLLRPIVVYISHRSALKQLSVYLNEITRVFTSAKLKASVTYQPFKSLAELVAKEEEVSPLEPFMIPLESVVTVNLPAEMKVNVTLRTILQRQMPPQGTDTVFTTTVTVADTELPEFPVQTFLEISELRLYLLHCQEIAVAQAVKKADHGWKSTAQANEISKTVKVDENLKAKVAQVVAESESRLVVRTGFVGDLSMIDTVWDGRFKRDLVEYLNRGGTS